MPEDLGLWRAITEKRAFSTFFYLPPVLWYIFDNLEFWGFPQITTSQSPVADNKDIKNLDSLATFISVVLVPHENLLCTVLCTCTKNISFHTRPFSPSSHICVPMDLLTRKTVRVCANNYYAYIVPHSRTLKRQIITGWVVVWWGQRVFLF